MLVPGGGGGGTRRRHHAHAGRRHAGVPRRRHPAAHHRRRHPRRTCTRRVPLAVRKPFVTASHRSRASGGKPKAAGTHPAAGIAREAPAYAAASSQAPAHPHHAPGPPAPRALAREPPLAHHALPHAPSQGPTARTTPSSHISPWLESWAECGTWSSGLQAAQPELTTTPAANPAGTVEEGLRSALRTHRCATGRLLSRLVGRRRPLHSH